MTHQIVQTFVEPDMRVDLYADGDAIITRDTSYFQLSADLIRSLAAKSKQPVARQLPQSPAGIDIPGAAALQGANTAPEISSTPRLRTTPGAISRQVVNTPNGWQAKFLEGQVIVTYFYESRSLARNGEVTDQVGENGRIG